LPPNIGEPPKRLVAWAKVQLAPGEGKSVTLAIEPQYLSIFDVGKDDSQLVTGEYHVHVGESSRSLPLNAAVQINAPRK
jgi:beta-glucosidase